MIEETGRRLGWRRWRVYVGMTGLLLALAVMVFAQCRDRQDEAEFNQIASGGAFGYANPQGRRFLIPTEERAPADMGRFTRLVVSPGRVLPMTPAGRQPSGQGDTGRQTPRHFGVTAGYAYGLPQVVGDGADGLAATETFLAGRTVVLVTALPRSACTAATSAIVAGHAGRAVLWCKDVAALPDGGRFSLARYAPKGREELVTLAYEGPGGPAFLDYPGQIEGSSVWRVDDHGEFPVEAYRVLFAFRTEGGLEFAVKWQGDDSDAMGLFRQEGKIFAPYIATSWYRVAE